MKKFSFWVTEAYPGSMFEVLIFSVQLGSMENIQFTFQRQKGESGPFYGFNCEVKTRELKTLEFCAKIVKKAHFNTRPIDLLTVLQDAGCRLFETCEKHSVSYDSVDTKSYNWYANIYAIEVLRSTGFEKWSEVSAKDEKDAKRRFLKENHNLKWDDSKYQIFKETTVSADRLQKMVQIGTEVISKDLCYILK